MIDLKIRFEVSSNIQPASTFHGRPTNPLWSFHRQTKAGKPEGHVIYLNPIIIEDVGDDASFNDPHDLQQNEQPFLQSSHAVVDSSETVNISSGKAQAKARTMPMVATSCGLVLEVDRGGIEPPTPGFSVLCSTD